VSGSIVPLLTLATRKAGKSPSGSACLLGSLDGDDLRGIRDPVGEASTDEQDCVLSAAMFLNSAAWIELYMGFYWLSY
jgi:hypothetical protein